MVKTASTRFGCFFQRCCVEEPKECVPSLLAKFLFFQIHFALLGVCVFLVTEQT